ncbi:MAG TPA: SurA N-terminal domain-containing protein [Solirubrobacterales bacterium]|nr:SurA N-terminal domain-containing protein [Solirubrobacterales bacterium]
MGAKAGQRGNTAGRQRLALILFGALLALLFIGFAVAQGITPPSVPSDDVAIVQEVPDDISSISKKEFDRAIARQVAQAKLKKTPAPGSDKYEELKKAALGEMLDEIWLQGEAEELDLTVTDKEVEDELANIKKESFPTPSAYKKFLEESKFTEADVDARIRLQKLSAKIQETVSGEAPKPSSAEIEDYYEAEKATQFTTKESRDVRLVINKDKGKVEEAKEALEEDNSAANWKKVTAKYSTDPTSKAKGGLQEEVTEEFLKGPLKTAIFGSATGELVGPVKFETNWFLVEPVKLNPGKVQTLAEAKAQIEGALEQEIQQEFFAEFVADYQSKWTSRTYCGDDYLFERCANFVGSGHPANASPACYEADPKTPATECPSPVTPISPALPGSITVQKPKGEPFPQRPLPESTPEQGEKVPTPPPVPQGE